MTTCPKCGSEYYPSQSNEVDKVFACGTWTGIAVEPYQSELCKFIVSEKSAAYKRGLTRAAEIAANQHESEFGDHVGNIVCDEIKELIFVQCRSELGGRLALRRLQSIAQAWRSAV